MKTLRLALLLVIALCLWTNVIFGQTADFKVYTGGEQVATYTDVDIRAKTWAAWVSVHKPNDGDILEYDATVGKFKVASASAGSGLWEDVNGNIVPVGSAPVVVDDLAAKKIILIDATGKYIGLLDDSSYILRFKDAGGVQRFSVSGSGAITGSSVLASSITSVSWVKTGTIFTDSYKGKDGGTGALSFYCKNTDTTPAMTLKDQGFLLGTTEDDGVNTLQVDGSAIVKGVSTTELTYGMFKVVEVTLADEASVDIKTLLGGTASNLGILNVTTAGNISSFGEFYISGAGDTVQLDAYKAASATDADGYTCVYSTGSGAYSLKNRLGSTVTYLVTYKGRK